MSESLASYQTTAAALIGDDLDEPTASQAPGTELVARPLDGELISRETRLAILEQQAVECRNQYLHARFALGAVLMEHRALCAERQTRFHDLCGRLGISTRSAYEHIAVAQTVQQFPSLKDLAEGQFKKLVAVIEGTTEEQIAQIAAGAGPITVDEIDTMSLRMLKAKFRKMRDDAQKVVSAEIKLLKSERNALAQDLAAARAALETDSKAFRLLAKTALDKALDFGTVCDQMMDQLDLLDGQDIQRARDEVNTSLNLAHMRFKTLTAKWLDLTISFGIEE